MQTQSVGLVIKLWLSVLCALNGKKLICGYMEYHGILVKWIYPIIMLNICCGNLQHSSIPDIEITGIKDGEIR